MHAERQTVEAVGLIIQAQVAVVFEREERSSLGNGGFTLRRLSRLCLILGGEDLGPGDLIAESQGVLQSVQPGEAVSRVEAQNKRTSTGRLSPPDRHLWSLRGLLAELRLTLR